MATFFTADLHLGHLGIITYTNRPYACVGAMNDDLVERWNKVVGEDDEVWVLGDLALGKLDESLLYVQFLNGHITLVPGNHDRCFRKRGPDDKKAKNAEQRYLDSGIDAINHAPVKHLLWEPPLQVVLNHFPHSGDSRDDDSYAEHRPTDSGSWLLHGHVHDRWRQHGRQINVGVDAWGGCPVSEQQLYNSISTGPAYLAPIPWVR